MTKSKTDLKVDEKLSEHESNLARLNEKHAQLQNQMNQVTILIVKTEGAIEALKELKR